jgi:hypothetical protein
MVSDIVRCLIIAPTIWSTKVGGNTRESGSVLSGRTRADVGPTLARQWPDVTGDFVSCLSGLVTPHGKPAYPPCVGGAHLHFPKGYCGSLLRHRPAVGSRRV